MEIRELFEKFVSNITNTKHRLIFTSIFYKNMDVRTFCNLELSDFKNKIGRKLNDRDLLVIFQYTKQFGALLDNSQESAVHSLEQKKISLKFSFLNSDELDFVISHKEQYRCYPMFRIALEYIRSYNNRLVQIWAKSKGLLSGTVVSLSKIASEFGLSRERIRQLANKDLPEDFLLFFKSPEWDSYDFRDTSIVDESYFDIKSISDKEGIDITYENYIEIICISGSFRKIKLDNKFYAIKYTIVSLMDWDEIISVLKKRLAEKRVIDEKINIGVLFPKILTLEEECMNQIIETIIILAKDILAISVDDNNNIILNKNTFDYNTTIEQILLRYEVPLHYDEILELFNSSYPKNKILDSKEIKKWLKSNDNIITCGYSGLYRHKECCEYIEVYNYIRLYIDKFYNMPVHVSDIMDWVHTRWPNATNNSIESIIFYRDNYEIIRLKNNYYALYDSYTTMNFANKGYPALSFYKKLEYLRFVSKMKTYHFGKNTKDTL